MHVSSLPKFHLISQTRKADIQFACTLHSTVTIDELRDQVKASNTMLMKLTSIIEFQSDREKAWEQTVAQYGGPKRILDNPDDLQTVANIIEGRGIDNTATDVAKSTSAGGPGGKPSDPTQKAKDGPPGQKLKVTKDESKFNRRELLEVQQPLSKLLDESRVYYERKLDAQVQFLANQIERSTQRILHRIDGGYWMKIQDPDLQMVWKENVSARTCLRTTTVEPALFL